MSFGKNTKAVWAFLTSLIGATTAAVLQAPAHTLGAVDTLGWLGVAGTVVMVTGGVYGFTNTPPS